MAKVIRIVMSDEKVQLGVVMKDKTVLLANKNILHERTKAGDTIFKYNRSTCRRAYITTVTDPSYVKLMNDFLKSYLLIQKKEKEIEKQTNELSKAKELFTNTGRRLVGDFRKAEEKAAKEKKLAEIERTVDGTENFSMSFMKSMDTEKAYCVIKKTDRPIFYRYGYAWKGARAGQITKEKALEYLDKGGWLDIDATDEKIEINEFSGSDMC